MQLLNQLFLLASLSLTSGTALDAPFRSCPNVLSCSQAVDSCCSPSMGLMVLAIQWVSGLGPSDAWTLHGLWPNNCDGSYGPSNGCDSSRNYSNIGQIVAADSDLKSKMTTYWSSYKGDNAAFWTHEWTKHGTCLSTVEPRCYGNYQQGQDALDYFAQALTLREKYDLYPKLLAQGIKPGRTYSRDELRAALKKELGVEVTLKCKKKSLEEVAINFDVKGKDEFILTDATNFGNCPAQSIQYNPK